MPFVGKAVADARQSRKPYAQNSESSALTEPCRWITARGQFHYAADGEAEGMLGMAVDITERKLAEEALKKSEEKFSKAFQRKPDGPRRDQRERPSLPRYQRNFRTNHWLAT